MSKKIAFFICSLRSGGAEHQLTFLANSLVKKNYSVKVITFSEGPDHYIIDNGIERVNIVGKNRFISFWRLFFYLLNLKVDCFISFGQRENLISLIPFLFKKTTFVAGERNFTVGKPSNTEKILVNLLYRRANHVVPNSESQAEHLKKGHNYLAQKITVISNYTNLDVFQVRETPINRVTKIGVFCRFEPQKNILRFEKALARVKATCSVPFSVDWYGNHSFSNSRLQQYFNEFLNGIKQDKLEDIVYIHEPVKDVQNYLPLYDCIALPSLHEGFSNSISEAICCGRPMLVSDVSDNHLMVHEGVNGFLFDPNSVEDISKAIIRFLFLSQEEKENFGQESRIIAERMFNKDTFISKYETLFY